MKTVPDIDADTELDTGVAALTAALTRLAGAFPFRAAKEARKVLDVVTDIAPDARAKLEKLSRRPDKGSPA